MRPFLVVVLLVASFAAAEDYGFGRGKVPQRIASENVVVNRAVALTQSAPVAGSSLQLSGTVEVGDLLLVHQTTVGTDGGAAWASAEPGRYVFRRVTAVSGETATLDAPLEVGFEVPGAQAVVVAEYSQLDIEADAGLVAPAWNGSTGGIVAVLVDGVLRNDGRIDASGRGYRSAPSVLMTGQVGGGPFCDQGWALTRGLFAPRGEGWGAMALGLEVGLTTDTSGGAGGACPRSGGGGGAGPGVGGGGGVGQARLDANGLGGGGGLSVTTDLRLGLLFGGGGGGGAGINVRSSAGGAGGGIVYLRARAVLGRGVVAADGQAGAENAILVTGGGGGGAGGTVVLWSQTAPSCASISAVGGKGGEGQFTSCHSGIQEYATGPGGGGGGGRIWLRPGGACPAWAHNGLAGTVQVGCGTTPPRGFNGAEPEVLAAPFLGTVELEAQPYTPELAPDAGLAALEWLTPSEGQRVASRRPTMTGRASPGVTVSLTLDGVPAGALRANAEGGFALAAQEDLADGPHTVSAATASGAATRSFFVDTLPPDAPAIRTPAHRSVLSVQPDVVAGTATSGLTIAVLLDGVPTGESLADDAGRWSLALDSALALDAGSHTLDAWARRGSGPSSEPAAQVQFTLAPSLLGSGQKVGVGCGCTAAPGAFELLPWLVLATHAFRAKRRRRSPSSWR